MKNPILYFPQMTVWTTKVKFRCFLTDLNNFFFFDLEIWWGFKIRYCTFPKWLSGPQKSNFLVYGPIWIFFFFDLEIWWGFQIWYCTFPKWLSGPQKSNFHGSRPILIIWWGFQIWYCTSNDSLDHKIL